MISCTMVSFILTSVPYYYNPTIHNLGNIGFGGKIHATIGIFATKLIDNISYKGINIRNEIMQEYKENSVLDLCCGIGESTIDFGTGIDTSPEMISVAKFVNRNSDFYIGTNYISSTTYIEVLTGYYLNAKIITTWLMQLRLYTKKY